MGEVVEGLNENQTEKLNDLDLYDPGNPLSLFTMLNNAKEVMAAIKALPPSYLEQTERELQRGWKPDEMTLRLKISFWEEYRRAQRDRGKNYMVIGNVLNGICSRPYFYEKFIRDRMRLAWLVSPPPSDKLVQAELYQLGMKRMREVLLLPIIEVSTVVVKGKARKVKKVNVSLIKEMRAIMERMEDRLHGSVIQKQEVNSKNLNLNVDTASDDGAEPTMKDLDRMLAKISQAQKLVKGPGGEQALLTEKDPDVLDVEAQDA